jgi:hypothetical protein
MVRPLRIATLLLLAPLLSCAPMRSAPASAQPSSALAALKGTWNWVGEGCDKNPFILSPSPDGSTITLSSTEPDSAGTLHRTEYRVLEQASAFVRGQITDEDRRTASGKLVVWDFVVLSPDRFCWRRTDWPSTGCTKPLQRCEGRAAARPLPGTRVSSWMNPELRYARV